jgi:hypothetical protein
VYRWHDAEHPTSPTWIERWFAKIADASGRALNTVWNLLRRLWPHGPNLSTGNVKGGGWKLKDIRSWLLLVGGLTLAVGTVLVWMRRRRESDPSSIPVEIVSVPDLSDTAVATERSEDEWFQLAIRLEKDGELRFALRAAYLGLLAGLGQRQWLTIRRDRTNREYLTEFTRRWRRRPQAAVEIEAEVPEKLSGSLRQFDRVWYGAQAVTPETVTAYRRDQMELLDHV